MYFVDRKWGSQNYAWGPRVEMGRARPEAAGSRAPYNSPLYLTANSYILQKQGFLLQR